MPRFLITGGAGYIGSHMVRLLLDRGAQVVVFDDLSTGHRDLVAKGATLVRGSLSDPAALKDLFAAHGAFDAVFHFAARSLVGESVARPLAYWRDNLGGTLALVSAMVEAGVDRLIFSSTAAVYGVPETVPIPEGAPAAPINPYGETKRAIETMLKAAHRAHGLRSVSLRYFNAAGAHESGRIGEWHEPETHLIPNVLKAALGEAPAIRIFGTDYDTPDGTAVRDYVHVMDLVEAHALALAHLDAHDGAHVFNLGCAKGFSVREVIRAAETVVGRPIPVEEAPRRPGDPPVLVADSSRARELLGWRPTRSELERIIADAWAWHRQEAQSA
ncbi:MAG: UDP-glucose 4-epimerase GalE [Alphaproteobacteria bacterium]|nr:MAG: UDP-glucose 4-epimerase GalE [Alphaproteobacteria bacterium]